MYFDLYKNENMFTVFGIFNKITTFLNKFQEIYCCWENSNFNSQSFAKLKIIYSY